jgi:F0F1-type ATP synthase assembly protein I
LNNFFKEQTLVEKEKEKSEKPWSAVSLAWELGYSIAVPLVGLALVGRFLDKKLGTSPWLILAGILISILISSYLIYKKTVDILDKE